MKLTPTKAVDLVTETDQAVEKIISTSLREKYPDFAFMGEETYKPGDKLPDAPTCTYLDPNTSHPIPSPHHANTPINNVNVMPY